VSAARELSDVVDSVAGDVVVQPMRRRHLRAVVAIERDCNPHPWSLSLFTGELRMPGSRHWVVATDAMSVLGFAGLMVTLDEGHITNLAVHPDARRRRVASRMLVAQFREAIDRGVRDLTLEVRVSNTAARALYGRFGFSPGGIRAGYYRDNGEDALVLWAVDIASPEGLARLERIEAGLSVRGRRAE